MGSRGVVAAGDPQTAEAGAVALRAGGNAVDAAVAAGFASFVAEPPLATMAGGGVMLAGSPSDGFHVVDAFAVMPGLGLDVRPDPLDFFGVEVDFGATTQVFHIGRGSVAVPGALPGLLRSHARWGRLPLREVVAPAVQLGREGFVLSGQVFWINRLLEPIMTHSPGVRRTVCVGDSAQLAPPNSRLYNTDMADFLEEVGRVGEAVLCGEWRRLLLATAGPQVGGLLTEADLDAYEPVVRAPLAVKFGGRTVLSNPPPSAGGVLVGVGLKVAARLGLADRAFMSPGHVAGLAAVLRAMSDVRGEDFDQRIARPGGAEQLLESAVIDRLVAGSGGSHAESALGSTTHISVLDADQGAASLTLSNGEGCGFVAPGTGVHLNNFLGEEDINPLGFHQLAPGTRLSTMMAPTVVLDGGRPVLVVGTGGSNRIRSVLLQALLHRLAHGRELEATIAAPRLHVEGSRLWYERVDMSDEAAEALEGAWPGATSFAERNMYFGGVHAVEDFGVLRGAGDGRRGGAVVIA